MLEIKLIDQEHQADIRLKNEPFSLWGKMLPTYNEGNWQYTICKFAPEDIQTMRFPDENYCYDEMSRNSLFIGAYDDGKCIGLAIVQDAFFKYLYLYDLKVNTDYRQQGVGQLLIQQALKAALAKGYRACSSSEAKKRCRLDRRSLSDPPTAAPLKVRICYTGVN